MAATEGGIGRREGFVDALLTPRRVTHFILIALGVAMSELAWVYLTLDLSVYVSGIAAPFCMLCATAIWSMRDKVESAMDPEYMDAGEFRETRATHRKIRARSMKHAAITVVCALAAAGPAISHQLLGYIYHWMLLMAGAGTAQAAFGYLLANSWETQLMEYRERLVQRAKDREAKSSLENAIRRSEPTPGGFPGWTDVADELKRPH